MVDFEVIEKSLEGPSKINIDLIASGVAYREWLEQPVSAVDMVKLLAEKHHSYFWERLSFYREQLPQKIRWLSGTPPKGQQVLAYVKRGYELAVYKTEGWCYLSDGRYIKGDSTPQYWTEIPPPPSR